MECIFSTERLHRYDRFEYWHQIACRRLVNHDSQSESRANFSAKIEADDLGAIKLIMVEHSPLSFSRSKHHVARLDSDDLLLVRPVCGQLGLDQGDRHLMIPDGSLVLLDPTSQYAGQFVSGAKVLVLKIPRRELVARIGNVGEFVAQPIAIKPGVTRLLASLLEILPAQTDCLDHVSKEIIASQTFDLLAVSFCSAVERQPRISSARRFILLRVRAAVQARLRDPELNAEHIVATIGVSVRYANSVLAEQGTSLRRLIVNMRLDRVQKVLSDPKHSHRTLTDIAYAWGFNDMTHFSRSFKKRFGMLPSEYRRSTAECELPKS